MKKKNDEKCISSELKLLVNLIAVLFGLFIYSGVYMIFDNFLMSFSVGGLTVIWVIVDFYAYAEENL